MVKGDDTLRTVVNIRKETKFTMKVLNILKQGLTQLALAVGVSLALPPAVQACERFGSRIKQALKNRQEAQAERRCKKVGSK